MNTGRNLKVLVVDDAYFMRELIVKELREFGCEVVGEAKNGLEAIKMYKKHQPDIVTMDIKMPEMSGIEAIKEIKNINPLANIIVITGVYDSKKEALNAGADDFLKKPFQPAFLWEKIENIVARKTSNNMEAVKAKNKKIKEDLKENANESTEKNVVIEGDCEDDLLSFNSLSEDKVDNDIVFEINSKPDVEEFIIETRSDNKDPIDLEEESDSFSFPQHNNIEKESKNQKLETKNFDKNIYRDRVEDGDIEEDDEIIMISIKPPRNAQHRESNYIKNLKEDGNFIEAPIINYVEEEKEETQLGFFEKIKNLFKIN